MTKKVFPVLTSLILMMVALCSCARQGQEKNVWYDADRELAASILSDSTLIKVERMGHQLLTRGYNAGNGYREVWIRDFNTFIETVMDVVPQSDVRDALSVFFKMQQPNGEIIDGYVPKDSRFTDPVPYYSEADTDHVGFKNTVETDQETSLIQAVRKYVMKSGDRAFLDLDIDGKTVYERMSWAVSYLMTERYSDKYGLIVGALTADWGDVENEPECCIDIGEGSTVTVDIYDNAMMVIALRDLQELSPDKQSADKWKEMEGTFRKNIRKHLWNDSQQRFIPHLYPDGQPEAVYFDEASIYYHGGTAIAIEADLLTPDEVRKVNEDMLDNVRRSGMPSIGLTLYPAYPYDFFPPNSEMKYPYRYQNGGDWTWFGGRMIQQLIRYGMVAEAYQEVRPMIDRVLVNGDFYEWYGIGNTPRGSSAFKGSAGVLCKAIVMLREWASERV